MQFSRGKIVVKNALGIFKKNFINLSMKSNLSILFIPNVITCSCMFYNLILDGRDVDVNALMFQLEQEVQHDPNVVATRKQHSNMANS
jgi:hypothetical protein